MLRTFILIFILITLVQPVLADLVVESRTVQSDTFINITLTEAPNGLSGYNITVSVENSSIAEIESVEFPDWATLHDNSTLPSSTVWIKAVDLNECIQQNATDITLATLKIKVKGTGITHINVTSVRMDDDNGYPMYPRIFNGTIEVQQTTQTSTSSGSSVATPAGAWVTSGGGGGGGGGGSSISTTSDENIGSEEIKITAPTEVKANSYFTLYIEVPYNATIRIKLPEGWTATKTEITVNNSNVSTFIGVPRDAEGNYTITIEVISGDRVKIRNVTIKVIKVSSISMPFFYTHTTSKSTPTSKITPELKPTEEPTPTPTTISFTSKVLSKVFEVIITYIQLLIKTLLRILTPFTKIIYV